MGFSKYSMLVVLALAAVLWLFGRAAFSGTTKWLLWALAALCAGAGVIAVVGADGPLAVFGGLALWVFAAYSIKVAESLRKRRRSL